MCDGVEYIVYVCVDVWCFGCVLGFEMVWFGGVSIGLLILWCAVNYFRRAASDARCYGCVCGECFVVLDV